MKSLPQGNCILNTQKIFVGKNSKRKQDSREQKKKKNEVEKSVQSEIRKNEDTFKVKWKGLIKVQVDLLEDPTHN